MKWLFFFISISTSGLFSFSQTPLIDSIKTTTTTNKKKELGEIFRRQGISFKNQGKYKKAEECYNFALNIYLELSDSIGISSVYNSFALLLSKKGNKPEALKYFYQAININEKINYSIGLTNNYLNLGNFFFHQNDFDQSLEYFYLCKKLLNHDENRKMLALIHTGIGNILSNNDYKHNSLDKAQKEYISALIIYQQLKDSLNISRVYNNLGYINERQNNYDDAINYYTNGLSIKQKLNDQKGILISHLNIGNTLRKKKEYTKSLNYYEKGKAMAELLKDGENYLNILSNIVNVHMALGNMELATKLFDEYRDLRDSIFNEEKSRQLSELQTLYETGQKELALKKQILVNKQKTKQNQRLFWLSVILSGFILTAMILYYQRQKVRKHLRDKEAQLHHQELSKLEKEQEITLLNSLMKSQEEERKRIAEDLHDRLGAKLSAIKLFHESSKNTNDKRSKKVRQLLDETINETREIAHNLASATLTQFGLKLALKDLIDTINASNKIEAHFSCTNFNTRLSEKTEQAIYYVIQELITNTLRHAEASSLSIHLTKYENSNLSIVYEDNGKGFDVENIQKDSMGIKNIKARLSHVNASLTIDSNVGSGSTFLMVVSCI
ncbi:MAG: sensor histidine kinase [Cyclobacteriaceae bacterium]|nr:sensor histidine kinase [Cyclobacteriaceae bacterium]